MDKKIVFIVEYKKLTIEKNAYCGIYFRLLKIKIIPSSTLSAIKGISLKICRTSSQRAKPFKI